MDAQDQQLGPHQKLYSETESTAPGSEATSESMQTEGSPLEAGDDACFVCGGVQEWLRPESSQFHCLRVPRAVTWGDIQQQVDGSIAGFDTATGRMHQEVAMPEAGQSDEQLAAEFSNAARCIYERARKAGLPEALCQQVQRDCEEIAFVLKKMIPTAKRMIMKLELMGEGVCSRWHQDYYTGRAIVTYNGLGTVYTRHENVDFWELENCGNNDCILADKSQVYSVNTGDILLIKGKLFPSKIHGLVHKAPEKQYHASGEVKNRLLLKVDLL